MVNLLVSVKSLNLRRNIQGKENIRMKTFKNLKFGDKILKSKRAHVIFPNEYEISVIGDSNSNGAFQCDKGTYEVAILKNGELYFGTPFTKNGEDVLGFQTPEQITEIMEYLRNLPNEDI